MRVSHHDGSYEIRFESLDATLRSVPSDAVFITDENVGRIYGSRLPSADRVLQVPPGESSKSVSCWAKLHSQLVNLGVHRRSTLIAFGGGVVGDLAGFVAATYMRGVPFIQVPTSLLSQVDSSVGGKVGIDLAEGKNLVGSFYRPQAVHVCDEVLDSLPQREFINGMAEVWKAGFIFDEAFVEELTKGVLLRPDIVRHCIDLKRKVVEADEFEKTGERAKLNFGHTVGHAIEKLTGYGPVLHGEAISIGMVVEAQLGEDLGITVSGSRKWVEDCLSSQGLPTTSVLLANVDDLVNTMLKDKKARDGRMAFSLLSRVGNCRLVEGVPEDDVRSSIKSFVKSEVNR